MTKSGNNSTFRCSHDTVMGNNNTIYGSNNTVMGNNNTIYGSNNHAMGNNNTIYGSNNHATGHNNNLRRSKSQQSSSSKTNGIQKPSRIIKKNNITSHMSSSGSNVIFGGEFFAARNIINSAIGTNAMNSVQITDFGSDSGFTVQGDFMGGSFGSGLSGISVINGKVYHNGQLVADCGNQSISINNGVITSLDGTVIYDPRRRNTASGSDDRRLDSATEKNDMDCNGNVFPGAASLDESVVVTVDDDNDDNDNDNDSSSRIQENNNDDKASDSDGHSVDLDESPESVENQKNRWEELKREAHKLI